MADVVHTLLAVNAARRKLAARGIGVDEAQQLVSNRHVVARNPRGLPPAKRRGTRRVIVGLTNGGRALTLVVESTIEPSDWLIVTGWDSAKHERRILER